MLGIHTERPASTERVPKSVLLERGKALSHLLNLSESEQKVNIHHPAIFMPAEPFFKFPFVELTGIRIERLSLDLAEKVFEGVFGIKPVEGLFLVMSERANGVEISGNTAQDISRRFIELYSEQMGVLTQRASEITAQREKGDYLRVNDRWLSANSKYIGTKETGIKTVTGFTMRAPLGIQCDPFSDFCHSSNWQTIGYEPIPNTTVRIYPARYPNRKNDGTLDFEVILPLSRHHGEDGDNKINEKVILGILDLTNEGSNFKLQDTGKIYYSKGRSFHAWFGRQSGPDSLKFSFHSGNDCILNWVKERMDMDQVIG